MACHHTSTPSTSAHQHIVRRGDNRHGRERHEASHLAGFSHVLKIIMLKTKKEWHDHIKCHEGYRSKFEAGIARQLEEAGVWFEYETDRLEYRNSQGKKFYVPDFTIYRPDGSVFYIEAKGWVDGAANSKMQAVRKFNLHADIRFVFQKENTKVANLKSTVCQWAKRLRYGFAVGAVPAEWLAEANTAA